MPFRSRCILWCNPTSQIREKDAITVVLDGTRAGQNVGKTFHSDMPSCVKEVLNEFKDVFPTDLPLGLPPMRKGHKFRIDLEDMTTPVPKPVYKLSPLELEETKKQIDYMLEHRYIRP